MEGHVHQNIKKQRSELWHAQKPDGAAGSPKHCERSELWHVLSLNVGRIRQSIKRHSEFWHVPKHTLEKRGRGIVLS